MAQKRSLTRSLTRKQKIGGKTRTAVKKGGNMNILNKLNMSFNNSKIKEGFINIDTCKFNRNHLIIATAAVLLIGLYLIH